MADWSRLQFSPLENICWWPPRPGEPRVNFYDAQIGPPEVEASAVEITGDEQPGVVDASFVAWEHHKDLSREQSDFLRDVQTEPSEAETGVVEAGARAPEAVTATKRQQRADLLRRTLAKVWQPPLDIQASLSRCR